MRSSNRKGGALPSLCALAVLSVFGAAGSRAETLYAVDAQNLLMMLDSATPNSLTVIGTLAIGEGLRGIDVRPSDGRLYAVGQSGTVYTVDPSNGSVTTGPVLSTLPTGTSSGVDFNPVADRLRLTSNTGQNLRANVDTGATIVDGTLTYAPGDVNAGMTPDIVASAYTNSVAGAVSTTLYNIDATQGTLVSQVPPNAGTLNTLGSLGVNVTTNSAFDISGLTGVGYAALETAPGVSALYIIDYMSAMGTGNRATLVGMMGNDTSAPIIGLAVAPGSAAIPEPGTLTLLGGAALMMLKRRAGKKTA